MSVLNRYVLPRKLVHQASPQFKSLSLFRRRKRASDPIDSHNVLDSVEATTPAAPLLRRS
jgi:hypothetical protein